MNDREFVEKMRERLKAIFVDPSDEESDRLCNLAMSGAELNAHEKSYLKVCIERHELKEKLDALERQMWQGVVIAISVLKFGVGGEIGLDLKAWVDRNYSTESSTGDINISAKNNYLNQAAYRMSGEGE